MSIPSTVHAEIHSPCDGEQTLNKLNSSTYMGTTGDFGYVILFKVDTVTPVTWGMRTFSGPSGCEDPVTFYRSTAADDPLGNYDQENGSGTATVTEL